MDSYQRTKISKNFNAIFRFFQKFKIEDNGCWVWQKSLDNKGYGGFYYGDGKKGLAHRFSYEMAIGPIPENMTIDHLCKNKSCVNPKHLEVVTNRENVLRSDSPPAIHARKTHCINGHPFNKENTIMRNNGRWRDCRECNRRSGRNSYYRNKLKGL